MQRFKGDESGSIAITFGLIALGLVATAGIAIDHARVVSAQTRINNALDAASLAATKVLVEEGATNERLHAIAQATFEIHSSRLRDDTLTKLGKLTLDIDRAEGTVTAYAQAVVDGTLSRVIGFNTFQVQARSKAAHAIKDVELGLMLDVSGSMNDDGKLTALKAAGKNLLDVLLPERPSPAKIRIGLAPYSTAVNAGSYTSKVRGKFWQVVLDLRQRTQEERRRTYG